MQKYYKHIIIVVVILAIIIGAIIVLERCNAEPKPPVVELKLYSDNGVELEKGSNGHYVTKKYHTAYDGEPKGFNAIAYLNGEIFARYCYKDETKSYNYDVFSFSSAKENKKGVYESGISIPFIERGSYKITYSFKWAGGSTTFFSTENGSGRGLARHELPNIEHRIYIDII